MPGVCARATTLARCGGAPRSIDLAATVVLVSARAASTLTRLVPAVRAEIAAANMTVVERSASHSERARVTWCFAAGSVAGAVGGVSRGWELGVLVGWLVGALALIGWVWYDIAGRDAGATATLATVEDDSRTAARVVLVGASVVSLVAVAAGLRHAAQVGTGLEIALTACSLLSVVAAWSVVHTVFVLRYAHLYYGGDEPAGIDFPGGHAPTYRDFAYVAFTVGMTFQVSDTAITSPAMRSTLLRHALLSYLFGTAIIASTINVLASLLGR